MNELALFAGAGGGILGGKLLGWRTVCAVEIDAYCASILVQRQNDGILPPFPIWDDVCTFDGRPWRGIVDVVSGGFPCQDISVAGKGDGLDGERSGLWREFARILGEVRPRFAFVENSPALTIRGLGRVLGDLAALGFNARWGVLGADDAGAPHIRKRIWIVAADPKKSGCETRDGDGIRTKQESGQGSLARQDCEGVADADGSMREWQSDAPKRKEERRTSLERSREDVADAGRLPEGRAAGPSEEEGWRTRCEPTGCGLRNTNSKGLAQREGQPSHNGEELSPAQRAGWWESEPDVGRVANGVAARVDKLRALGNGQVPSVAALAWRLLSLENMKTKEQLRKEAATALRKREERERLQIQRDIIAGNRHPSGLLKTEEERMRDLHPDDPR